MKYTKLIFLSATALSASSLLAAIDPGTYDSSDVFTDTSLSSPNTNASWIFDGSTFSSNFSLEMTNGTAATDYYMQLKSSEMTFSKLNLARAGAGSSAVVELLGTADARSKLTGASGVWYLWLTAAGTSTTKNELRLSGYSDFSVTNFKITSDNTTGSGNAGVVISGASNTFTASDVSYVNYVKNAGVLNPNTYNLYFKISGVEGAKSSATFQKDLTIRSSEFSTTKFEMLGNAEFTVKGLFKLGELSEKGKSEFLITGSNNKFETTAAGNNFLIGSDLLGADTRFSIGGKNNTLKVAGKGYVGTGTAGYSSTATLEIKGSGHTINFNGGLEVRNAGDSKGVLSFVADADGVSTVNTTTMALSELLIDFTDFSGDGSGLYTVALVSATGAWTGANAFDSTGTSSNDIVTMGSTGLSWEIKYDGAGNLNFTYNYLIPEPSTYATIFGALALGFAAYRRKAVKRS